MLNDTDRVKVRNLTDQYVIYRDPDTNYRVEFQPHQERELQVGGLRKYFTMKGGRIILQNYLSVENDELRDEFEIPADQVEYDWDRDKIVSVLLNEDIAVLKDALDFGPDGIKDQIASLAVELRIPDNNKREAISNALGISITNKINLADQMAAKDGTEEKPAEKPTRRIQTNGRRLNSENNKSSAS